MRRISGLRVGICRQYDGVQLRPACSSAAAVQDQGAERETERRRPSGGLCTSSLATRLRIDHAAVRRSECSACWYCIILCMELQCISLQLMGGSFSIDFHGTPDNAGWTFVDMCLEQLAPAAGGTQIVVTTKELAFDPTVQARFCPASTNLMPSRAELSQTLAVALSVPTSSFALLGLLCVASIASPTTRTTLWHRLGGSSRSFGHRSSCCCLRDTALND